MFPEFDLEALPVLSGLCLKSHRNWTEVHKTSLSLQALAEGSNYEDTASL